MKVTFEREKNWNIWRTEYKAKMGKYLIYIETITKNGGHLYSSEKTLRLFDTEKARMAKFMSEMPEDIIIEVPRKMQDEMFKHYGFPKQLEFDLEFSDFNL